MSLHGDSKMIEEKLDQVSDLKTQIRCLITDNEEVKLNQEELNANMTSVTHQMSLLADAFDKLIGGRSDVAGDVSRVSRKSFRSHLPSNAMSQTQQNAQSKTKRKASLEGIVKQLTSLAVTISTDDVKNGGQVQSDCPSGGATSKVERQRLLEETEWERRGSGLSLPGRLMDKKLKRTNLMKRRESQALLEGVRKMRAAPSTADSGHNSNDNEKG